MAAAAVIARAVVVGNAVAKLREGSLQIGRYVVEQLAILVAQSSIVGVANISLIMLLQVLS